MGSATFPSHRFCTLMNGRLEYYEERLVRLNAPASDAPLKLGLNLNEWNLVIHVQPGSCTMRIIDVGDVVTAFNGVPLGDQLLAQAVRSAFPGKRRETKITMCA